MDLNLARLDGQNLLGGATDVVTAAGVKQLQEQLRRIAFEFGKGDVDPAKYDGTLTLGTIIALGNAAPIVGNKLHSAVGQAVDVIGLIKAPISKIPYGDTVINFVLSPWIVDAVFSTILAIIRLIPGGGGPASAIDKAMTAVKAAIASAAGPIGIALLAVKKSNGFGDTSSFFTITAPKLAMIQSAVAATAMPAIQTSATPSPTRNPPDGFTWVAEANGVPGHWERARVGQTPQPGPAGATVQVCDHRDPNASCASGGVTVTVMPRNENPLAPPQPGRPGIVRDHRTWQKGKEIVSADWGRARTYYGPCPKENLSARDRAAWEKNKDTPTLPSIAMNVLSSAQRAQFAKLKVRYGAVAFQVFRGFDGARMGAFWNEENQMLKIAVVPEPSSTKYPWDYAADAVSAAADYVSDVAQDTWNWIAENADDVYKAVKKYGCALVNNDIVVGLTAAGAGIVASPAASAAVMAGAAAGKAGCAVLEVGELLYAVYQLLSMDIPKPPPLTTPTPPPPPKALPVLKAGLVEKLKVILPASMAPVVPLAKPRYPAGSIAAYDPKIKRYHVAIPNGTQLQLGDSGSVLGAAASHFEVETIDFSPPLVSVVPLTIFQKQTGTLPLYKNPIFWVALGASTAAVGGGGYVLYRRRRRLTR